MAAQFRDYELPENVYKMCIFINLPLEGGKRRSTIFLKFTKGSITPRSLRTTAVKYVKVRQAHKRGSEQMRFQRQKNDV